MDINDNIRQMVESNARIDVPVALMSLRPNGQWVCRGDEYSGVEWLEGNETEIPTEEEVTAEIERLNGLKGLLEYRRLRKEAYANHEEQLDMQYWDLVNDTTTWKDHVAEVKANHPKPDGAE